MCAIKDSVFTIFRVACLILCLSGESFQVSIISINEFAVPEAIKVGENAELQCRYELAAGERWPDKVFLKWFWMPLDADTDTPYQIYQLMVNPSRLLDQRDLERQRTLDQQHPMKKHFSNIETKDNYTILLKDLQPKHSGRYQCKVSTTLDEVSQNDTMVVYTPGSSPMMNITEVADGPDEDEDEDVLVRCEASGVAPYPDLAITLNGQEIPVANIDEIVTKLPDGFFDIAANTTLSKPDVLGATIRCELFYNDSNITHEAYYKDYVYEAIGGANTSAPASESAIVAVNSTTAEASGDAGVAHSLAWGLLALAALLVAAPADLFYV